MFAFNFIVSGTPMENRYKLNGYGIPTATLPVSWTGNIKTLNLKQWIKIRQVVEQDSSEWTKPLRKFETVQKQKKFLVECPTLKDIIFKKGTSGMLHPGNVLFRSLVQSKYEQGNLLTTKSLMTATLDEIDRQALRVLVWNEKDSCFYVLRNPNLIYKKIEYLVRDFQFSSTKSQIINRRIADAIATNAASTKPGSNMITDPSQTKDILISVEAIKYDHNESSRKKFKTNQYDRKIGVSGDETSYGSSDSDCRMKCSGNGHFGCV